MVIVSQKVEKHENLSTVHSLLFFCEIVDVDC